MRHSEWLWGALALVCWACDGGETADGTGGVDLGPGPGDAAATPPDVGAADLAAQPDAAPPADAAPVTPDSARPDAAPSDAALPDARVPPPDAGLPPDAALPACDFPAPRLAAALPPELVTSRERCGAPPYAWLDDPRLGDLVERRDVLRLTAEAITAMAQAEGYPLPHPATHDTVVSQISYLTQDRGALIEATALVAYPVDSDPEHPAPLLVVLHGTSGFTDACAPSNSMDVRALGAVFASFGYVTVAPDYIGMRAFGEPSGFIHPYLVAEPTALASLDAIRAAAKMTDVLCAQPRVAIMGGSQGGHAALWTERVAGYYAPELSLVGTVATVPPADMVGQMTRALHQVVPATGNTLAFLSAASDWYGHLDRLGEAVRPPWDVDVPALMMAGCDFDAIEAPNALDELFQPALLDAAAQGTLPALDPWGCMTAENGPTTTSIPRSVPADPAYGLLVVLGEMDDLVNPEIERESVATLCAQGLNIVGLECQGASHTRATTWSLPEIVDFIDARFAGTPLDPAATCQPFAPSRCRGTPDDQ